MREYAGWERRYPQERAVYERELAFDLAGKDFCRRDGFDCALSQCSSRR